MKKLFNDGWLFAKTPAGSPEDAWDWNFSPVQVPHDWLIGDTENLYESSFGRYKKEYDFGEISGKSVRLYFEGVYMNCTIFVNRVPAFDWKYGYTSFEADITRYLHDGANEISVLVRHESPNSRWYSGAGIFRNVWLIETGESHLVTDSAYFSAKRDGNNWNCAVSAEGMQCADCTAEISLLGKNGLSYREEVPAGEFFEHGFVLENIGSENIWDISSPNLLALKITLKKGTEELDCIQCRVGLRTAEFTPDKGFLLNGKRVKLNGVCLHHDLGCLGAAVNRAALRRQLMSMLEMGVNAVRTSHNPPAVEFMELCDELGILVDSEAFDMWELPKNEYDYARFFGEWYQKDVASWVRRDRNHPCLIMWSVGNEIYDTHASPRGREVARALASEVRRHDPRGNAPTTIGSNYMQWEGAQGCAREVELAGYNYGERLYNEHHMLYPDWKIYGSETTSGGKSRGVYHFPASCAYLTHEDLQCSSLGNCRAGASAQTAGDAISANRDTDFCAGMFIWTGSDYIGEPSPYNTKNAYYGSIDTAGLKKDSFWLYQAAWTDKPVLHIMPYWDFNPGQICDVIVYTNQSEVELFVNNKSAGKRAVQEYTAAWQVPYEPGEIRAVAGELTAIEHGFGNSAKLVPEPERTEISADGEDMFVVRISTVDSEGYPVRNARDRVTVTVSGGRLLGFDNGDSTDFDRYKSASRRLFSGMAAAYIGAPAVPGNVVVTVSAPGLEPASVTVKALPAQVREGISTPENITDNPYPDEVPLRKIELTRSGSGTLSPDNPASEVTAKLLPPDTTYRDVMWKATTDSGIETNIAAVTATGLTAAVKPLGDGHFRLRCYSLNGRRQPEVISELEYTVTGFGQPFTDPYQRVRGCMYSDSEGLMDEVREGGVSITAEHNIVGYQKVNFGKYGSDSFDVPMINWFKNCPFGFRLWDGKPFADGSKKLGDFTYQADFIWQTYQENHYILCEPLTGVHDIYFEFDKTDLRIDFGGFRFVPRLKAYQTINAADCDVIHGDSYDVRDGEVVNIGNNVFLDFEDMDFRQGVSQISVTGLTHHERDSVHVRIVTDEVDITEILEFYGSSDYNAVTKNLEGISGKGTVKFMFLPGCDFDFRSFRFTPKED